MNTANIQSGRNESADRRITLDWRASIETKLRVKLLVMQEFVALRTFVPQPFMPVLGVLITAGAAKVGQGDWAITLILISLLAYAGSAATAIVMRHLKRGHHIVGSRQAEQWNNA